MRASAGEDQAISQSRDTAMVRERARKTIIEEFDLKRVCLPRQLELLGFRHKKEARS